MGRRYVDLYDEEGVGMEGGRVTGDLCVLGSLAA